MYEHTRRESKDDLRAEIERLEKSNKESDALLDALSSMDDVNAYNSVAQGLMGGRMSRQAIFQELIDTREGNRSREGVPRLPSRADFVSSKPKVAVCPYCKDQLPSSVVRRPSFSERNLFAEAPETVMTPVLPTPISLSPLPSPGNSSQLRIDAWTRTGWTVAYIRNLFDSLLTWDYLPFCLMCKDPYLRDYYSGSSRYCSSALVNALLALAMRMVNENQGEAGIAAMSVWSESKAFFDEAEAILHGSWPCSGLPDIQALGILALYQVSCGREPEARELSEAFAGAITDLCLREPLVGKQEEQYARVRATTYCGAISLVRYEHLLIPCVTCWDCQAN